MPGIDEDDLDDDDADDQIGEVEGDDVDDRRQRVRQRVAHDQRPRRHALQPRHLDVGRGQQVDDRRARHPHHVRRDDQRQRQRRQQRRGRAGRQNGMSGETLASDGKHREEHRQEQDQEVGDEEFGQRNRRQRRDVDRPVKERVPPERRAGCRASAPAAPRCRPRAARNSVLPKRGASLLARAVRSLAESEVPKSPCSAPAQPVAVADVAPAGRGRARAGRRRPSPRSRRLAEDLLRRGRRAATRPRRR